MLKKIIFFLGLFGSILQGQCQKYLTQIDHPDVFESLSGLPISNKYGQIDAVKLVLDLETNSIYYLNSKDYKFHHEFCREVLKDRQHLGAFNDANYSNSKKRKYLLGNLNLVHHTQEYFLELSPSDLMTIEQIKHLHSQVISSSFLNRNLALILNSNRLISIQKSLSPIPPLSPSTLFESLEYQAIHSGKTTGKLKLIKDIKKEFNSIKPTDIIILKETPLTIPQVSGIIVSEFQTPLSHITLLGTNRDIPIMALKEAEQHHDLMSFLGKQVSFQVKPDTFLLTHSTSSTASNSNEKSKNLKYNLDPDSLVILDRVHRKSYKYIGNKAHNFSELVYVSRNSNFKTPESAFAIPFSFYQKHIEQSGSQKLINKLLFYKAHHTDLDSIKIILREIRNSIKYHPLDKSLIKNVTKTAEKLGEYDRLRFRSSTNAEDMKGFSGAGLYTSKTGIIKSANKPIDEAIKKVWASLWSFNAFMEREYYNINQRTVFMGILVHRAFPKEEVNGVAITKNLYRDSYFGYVVNTQLGNEKVVDPRKGITCDQFICYPSQLNNMYDENQTIEVITTSSLNNGNLVMTTSEIQNLADQLYRIKNHFYNKSFQDKSFQEFALDVEFKLDGTTRQLYIKQVREFGP